MTAQQNEETTSYMLRVVREKIADIDAGRYGPRYDQIPGTSTITYTIGFALDRFQEMGSSLSPQQAFDVLDAEQINACQIIRYERGLPPLQYRQSHHRNDFGFSGCCHAGNETKPHLAELCQTGERLPENYILLLDLRDELAHDDEYLRSSCSVPERCP